MFDKGGVGESISDGVPSKCGPLLRLKYDEEQSEIREAFIDNGGADDVGYNDDNKGCMVKKGMGSSASGVVYKDDYAEKMIRIAMEDIEQSKVDSGGGKGGGRE